MQALIDLSHVLAPDMPVYPGTEPPLFRPANTIAANGFAETLIRMYSHTGTHVDAPSHMVAGAPALDQLPLDHFVGRAHVIDVSSYSGSSIPLSAVEAHQERLAGCSFALFHTGWSQFWGEERYFSGFPVLSAEAARWLAGRGLHGVGLDAISADPLDARQFSNHATLFGAGLVIVENLTGLQPLVGRTFLFSCLPLKYGDGDGSPVRAVAMIE